MRFLIALSLAMNVNVGIADETKDQCVLQDDTREELLALSFKDFDQSKNGWRQFQASGCFEIIRDLLASYIQIHPEAKNKHYMLTFHTGQFYAFLGDYDIALKLFAESYSGRVSKWSNWDAFVDANIAFLEKNVEGLEDARDLISEQEGKKISRLSREFGLHGTTLGKILDGGTKDISGDVLHKPAKAFRINRTYIETGVGEKFLEHP